MNKGIGGWFVGVQTLLVMHSGDGKSSILRSAAVAAANAGHRVLMLSTEDPRNYTVDRILAELTGLPTASLTRLDVEKGEAEQLRVAAAWQAASLVDVVSEQPDTEEAIQLIQGWVDEQRQETEEPLLVCVDYAQNLVTGGVSAESDLAEFGKQLNAMSDKYRLASIVASQVRSNALVEARERVARMKPPTKAPPNWEDFVAPYCPAPGDEEYCKGLFKKSKFVMSAIRPGKWAQLPPLGWSVSDDLMLLQILKNSFGGPSGGVQRLYWDGPTQTTREV